MTRRPGAIATTAILLMLAACTAGGTPSSDAPGAPTSPPPSGGTISTSPPMGGGPGGGPVGNGSTLVVPQPGQLEPRPVRLQTLTATRDGHHITISAYWYSGVAPCSVLDSILVTTGDHSFAIAVREGHGPQPVACIDIAQAKRALIDLGDLAPGHYTVSDATGGAPPITVDVPA